MRVTRSRTSSGPKRFMGGAAMSAKSTGPSLRTTSVSRSTWPPLGRELAGGRQEEGVPVAVGRVPREHSLEQLAGCARRGQRLFEVLEVAAGLVEHTSRVVVGRVRVLVPGDDR